MVDVFALASTTAAMYSSSAHQRGPARYPERPRWSAASAWVLAYRRAQPAQGNKRNAINALGDDDLALSYGRVNGADQHANAAGMSSDPE